MDLPELKLVIDKGKYPQALDIISNLGGEEKLEGLILKSQILERKGELKEALLTAEEIAEEYRAKRNKPQILRAILRVGAAHYSLRNTSELTEVLREAEEIFSEIKSENDEDI